MEAFSLLKYWRSSGVRSGSATTTVFTADSNVVSRTTTETIVTSAEDRSYSSDSEDGPYFDLQFGLPDQSPEISPETDETENENEDETETESGDISAHENDDDEEEGELKFALASNECTDQTVAALSPSDELFLKGNLVSIEPSEENSKLPVFLVKSATKLSVLLLNKLKKSKSINGGNLEKPEKSGTDEADAKKEENQGKSSGKFMAVTLKVEDGPLASLFTRDNSSKENGHGRAVKNNVEDNNIISDSKEVVVPKYLKLVKPFYIRVSKRYVEKLKFSGHLIGGGGGGGSKGATASLCEADKLGEGLSAAARADVKAHHTRQGLQAGLEVVRKHLGKSRSASAAVAAATPSNRRDDSLVQLQDGIQGAILHCKRSFNSSRDVESSSSFSRSVSDPSYEKSVVMPKDSPSSLSPPTTSFSGKAEQNDFLD
ncbi:hypothetical protein OROHE_024651 [Orobanche hederae]